MGDPDERMARTGGHRVCVRGALPNLCENTSGELLFEERSDRRPTFQEERCEPETKEQYLPSSGGERAKPEFSTQWKYSRRNEGKQKPRWTNQSNTERVTGRALTRGPADGTRTGTRTSPRGSSVTQRMSTAEQRRLGAARGAGSARRTRGLGSPAPSAGS